MAAVDAKLQVVDSGTGNSRALTTDDLRAGPDVSALATELTLATLAKDASISGLHDELVILDTDVLGVRNRLPAALSAAGRMTVDALATPDVQASGVLASTADRVTLAIPPGYRSWSLTQLSGTGTVATFVTEWSPDNAVSWFPLYGRSSGNGGASNSQTNPNSWQSMGAVPPGATHIRVRPSAFTSGSMTWVLSASALSFESVVAIGGGSLSVSALPALVSSPNMVGMIKPAGAWFGEGLANPAAGASSTGTGRDMAGVASGTVQSTTPTQGLGVVRLFSAADQPHALFIEWSDDNVIFDRTQDTITAGAVGAKYISQAVVEAASRFYRVVLTNNGPVATTFNRVRSLPTAIR